MINDVYTMRADGSDVRNLTRGIGFSGDAAYSPDGRTIALETDRGDDPAKQGIYLMDAKDGGHLRRVTVLPKDADFDGSARFSPNGRELVFTRFRNAHTAPDGTDVPETSALFVVRIDGGKLRQITSWDMHPGDADWSPDGKSIVFEADLVNGRGDAWVIRPDGKGLRNLTYRQPVPGHWDGFSDPGFSPDGRFVQMLWGFHYEDGSFTAGLATIRVDGSDLRYIGDGMGLEHQADWGQRH